MKKSFIGTFVLLMFGYSSLKAQQDVVKGLKTGFKSGNVAEISNLLAAKIEIAFEGEKKVYQKVAAENVFNDFFAKNKPTDFEILHQGASKIGLKFYIGEFKASTGTFRVLVYLRDKDSKSFIETIDISKE